MGVLILILISFVLFPLSAKLNNIFLCIGILLLTILNFGNSTDFYTYLKLGDYFIDMNYSQLALFFKGIEPSFYLISKIVNYIGFNSHFIIVIYTTASLFFVYFGAKKYKGDNLFFLIFLLFFINAFYFFNLTLIRQALAISIVFYAISSYIFNYNKKQFIFFVIFASFFHISAIFLLFFVFFLEIELDLRKIYILTLFVIIFSFFNPLVYFSDYLPNVLNKFSRYLISNTLSLNQRIYSISITIILFSFFYWVFAFNYRKKNGKLSNFENSIALLFFSVVLIRILAINLGSINRLSTYFILFIPVFIYHYLYLNFKSRSKLLFVIFFYFLSIFKLFLVVNISNGINTYQSLVINYCYYGNYCPIYIYGDTSYENYIKFKAE